MQDSDPNPDSSSGSTDGGQNDRQNHGQNDDQPATLARGDIADALAESGANAGQHGETMHTRSDALYEQCQEIASLLRADPETLSGEQLDALATEAIEAVGDIETLAGDVFEILSTVEEARARRDAAVADTGATNAETTDGE
jgi:L-lactate utilization protein LutC